MTGWTAISLFSGIGGLDLAFSIAGFDIVAQVEIDPFCRSVLEIHKRDYWNNTTIFADVRGVSGRSGKGWKRYNQLPLADVIFGGFPCQDISIAGQTAGVEEGTRSGLWFEFKRLIGEIRPQMFLLENVPNIKNVGGTTVVGDIAELGYDAQWGIISANDAGFPHLRKRWFCVGFSRGNGLYRETIARPGQNCLDGQRDSALEIQGRIHELSEIESAGEDVDIAHKHGNKRNGRAVGKTQGKTGQQNVRCISDSESETIKLPYTESKRLEGEDESRFVPGGCHNTGVAKGRTEPGLGRSLDGFPDWMVRPRQVAGYGEPQESWEPPRLVQAGTRNQEKIRKKRVEAIGNAVVPQVAFPIALMMKDWLNETSK